MFDSSIKRLVEDYHIVNKQYRYFYNNVFLDVDDNGNVHVKINGKNIFSMPRSAYNQLIGRMINAIGNSQRHRHFVLYHHLVSQGINVNP